MKQPVTLHWRNYLLAGLLLAGSPWVAQAQGVGIGTATPDASAVPDVVSSGQGVLLPRVASVAAVAGPATGLVVYQTGGAAGFYYYDGAGWQRLVPASSTGFVRNQTARQAGSNFNVSGNGTIGGNGAVAGTLTAAKAVVTGALTGNGASIGGVGVGVRADGGLNLGQNTTGKGVYLGFQAGRVSTGAGNLLLGYQGGYGTTTGGSNTFVGYQSGYRNVTGSRNTALGYGSGPAAGSTGLTNATAVGANVSLTASNTVVLGSGANVGVGTSAPNSPLHVNGAVSVAYATARANLTLTGAHYTVRRLAGCNTLTLPKASTCPGRLYVLINASGTGSNVRLAVTGGGRIYDDVTSATLTLLAPGSRLTVQADGTNWIVVGR